MDVRKGGKELTVSDGGSVEGVLLLEPVGGDEGVGIGLGLLHAIAASFDEKRECAHRRRSRRVRTLASKGGYGG